MDGMWKQYDGHTWCKTMTSNISNDFGLSFRKSACTGHLQCPNEHCNFISWNSGIVNSTEWAGLTPTPFSIGGVPPSTSTVVCKVCRTHLVCLALCSARIMYVYCSDQNTTRAAVHLGRHVHPVSDGVCMEALDQMYECVAEEVRNTPKGTNSAIVIAASKKFLADYLLRPKAGQGHLRGASLDNVMDKFTTLSSPNIRNFVSGAKKFISQGMGSWTVSWH